MSKILWKPRPQQIKQSRMYRFLQAVNQHYSLDMKTYPQLHAWSIKNISEFWKFYSRFANIHFHKTAQKILSSRSMPGAQWFVGAELNYAENLLQASADKTAIISKVEGQPIWRTTYGRLFDEVVKLASAFKEAGIKPGDRIAGFLPNIPEAVVGHLAASAMGAVWSSCSPDFGRQGVKDRFGQIKPRVLICASGYHYNGKYFSVLETINAIAGEVKSLTHIILVPFPAPASRKDNINFPSVFTWEEFVGGGAAPHFRFQPFPFSHPLCILYSSGTTGLPKCIVHGAGGTLLQHHKEHALHTDITSEDIVFYFTTCGWMMWNWLISALAQQATIVLYEGSPSHPTLETLWQLIEETKITIFGTSPKFLAFNQKQNLVPKKFVDLQSLKAMLSTGSPLDAESFRWVYENVNQQIRLSSISGGTDIISCFMLGNPMLPVRTEEIQCLGLGMDVVALDGQNRPVLNQKGELACLSPAPSMPIYFWDDPDGEKYRAAYFNKVPGAWIHGDFIEIKEHGGVLVYGRSDATLNPGGVRIGTAEIYRIVEQMDEIQESLIIGVEKDNDIRMILFVVLTHPLHLDDPLEKKIKTLLKTEASPRHVPQEIHQVKEIPHTLNGKKVELIVRNIFQGVPVSNRDALANPGCLAEFASIRSQNN